MRTVLGSACSLKARMDRHPAWDRTDQTYSHWSYCPRTVRSHQLVIRRRVRCWGLLLLAAAVFLPLEGEVRRMTRLGRLTQQVVVRLDLDRRSYRPVPRILAPVVRSGSERAMGSSSEVLLLLGCRSKRSQLSRLRRSILRWKGDAAQIPAERVG